MGRYTGKTCRLLTMLCLTASFFLVEILVGYITNSLALVGDSYHMLSDVISLLVGFASVRIAKWRTKKNTFGWARAEVLGALVNAVFLMALCFTIFVEALQRLFHDEHIHDPELMLIVGSIGLLINLIGLFMFRGHAHGHSHGGGGHGHSHDHSPTGDMDNSEEKVNLKNSPRNSSFANGEVTSPESEAVLDLVRDKEEDEDRISLHTSVASPKLVSSAQLNMKGVFLHVLGDALGSVIVIISALVIKFVEDDWKYKIDPAMSMVMVIIIFSTTIPLLKESALILLQTVPTHIQVRDLQEKLISKVDGVLAIHEFHVWQLAGNRIIASAHIHCRNLRDYMRIAEDVKIFFHNEGIHSTTIQPEFVEFEELDAGRDCQLECGPDKTCYPDTCCGKKIKPGTTPPAESPQDPEPGSSIIRQRTNGGSCSLSTIPQAPKASPEPSSSSLQDVQFR